MVSWYWSRSQVKSSHGSQEIVLGHNAQDNSRQARKYQKISCRGKPYTVRRERDAKGVAVGGIMVRVGLSLRRMSHIYNTVNPLFCEFCEPNASQTKWRIIGREYQLQTKIGRNYYSISNCMVLVRRNKGAKIILHAKSPTFWAAKLKGFTVFDCFMYYRNQTGEKYEKHPKSGAHCLRSVI